MNLESLELWLATLELNPEQILLANIARTLASSFDANGNTSTAAELRKTIIEIRSSVSAAKEAYDPLTEILKH
jgi:hypothetical protein